MLRKGNKKQKSLKFDPGHANGGKPMPGPSLRKKIDPRAKLSEERAILAALATEKLTGKANLSLHEAHSSAWTSKPKDLLDQVTYRYI